LCNLKCPKNIWIVFYVFRVINKINPLCDLFGGLIVFYELKEYLDGLKENQKLDYEWSKLYAGSLILKNPSKELDEIKEELSFNRFNPAEFGNTKFIIIHKANIESTLDYSKFNSKFKIKINDDELTNKADNWIAQFPFFDWKIYALKLLSKITYCKNDEIDNSLEEIKKYISGLNDFVISDIEGIEKSSVHLFYSLNKLIEDPNIKFVLSQNLDPSDSRSIVFVDDMIGTGHQASKYVKKLKADGKIGHQKLYYYAIIGLKDGINEIKKSDLFEVVLTRKVIYNTAFDTGYIFTAEESGVAKDMASNIGEQLTKGLDKIGPLGYENSGALVFFGHNSPNNSLPIFWASGKCKILESLGEHTEVNWIPLFPRKEKPKTAKSESTFIKPTSNVPLQNPFFTGREIYIEKLHDDDRGEEFEILKQINEEQNIPYELKLSDKTEVRKLSIKLKKILESKLSLEELRDFCFEINHDYENVGGETKSGKIREILIHLENRNELEKIRFWLKNNRPDIRIDIPHISDEIKKTVKEDLASGKNKDSYSSELESEIADIFKSIYQKDRKPGISEVNAKTLESLKHKLHDLKASGNNINWLDMGCGDGRCLEVLDDIQDRGNICYHGIDISYKFLDDAQMRARQYGIRSNIEKMNTSAMKFDSKFDLVSAILFLHEVDPLCLPYVIRNMLRALKNDGTLVISDFEGPYEQEEGVVSWGAQYLEKFLSNIGGVRMSPDFVPSGEYPKELGFYRCYVKKPELDKERFEKFIEGYGSFMKEKKEDSRKMREDLRSQINKRVCEILKRPDIDAKNITDEDKVLLRKSMGKEYGIKALKIRLLTNEILFLDEKISEFERGERCSSI